MRLKSIFNTALASSIALGMIACNQQERVNELAHGTYMEMSETQLLENRLPVEKSENQQTGDFLQDQNTASSDTLRSLIVSKDKKTIKYVAVESIFNIDSQNSDVVSESSYELNAVANQEGSYSTGVIDFNTTYALENVEAYLASKVKKATDDKEDEKKAEAKKEEKEEAKSLKVAVKDISPENRFRSNLSIRAIAPQIIAVLQENTHGKADGSTLTSKTTRYYKYVVNTQAEEINKAFNAKLVAKQKLAVATRAKIQALKDAEEAAKTEEQLEAAEEEVGAEEIAQEIEASAVEAEQAQVSLEVATEEVEKAKAEVEKADENLETTKKVTADKVNIPPVDASLEGLKY